MWRGLLLASCMAATVLGAVAQTPGAYSISGIIVDESSRQAIRGARVALVPSQQSAKERKALIADANGRFHSTNLAPGKYDLFAEAAGYPRQGLNAREQFVTAVVVGPGKDSDHVVFALRREARIVGTVTDEAGEPVREAQVRLFRRTQDGGEDSVSPSEAAATDDRGIYKIHVAPGEYYMAVMAKPWYSNVYTGQRGPEALDLVYPITFYGGATDDKQASIIVAKAGAQVQADVTLSPVRASHVRVSTKKDVNQGVTYLRKLFGTWEGQAEPVFHTTDRGEEVVDLAPGAYLLSVRRASRPPQDNQPIELKETAEIPLDVQGDMSIDPDQFEGQMGRVNGVVQVPGGLGIGSAITFDGIQRGQTKAAQIAQDGKFEIELAPGVYRAQIVGARNARVQQMIASGAVTAEGHHIIVGSGAGTIAIAATDQLATITGVVEEKGRPLSGVMVLLMPEHGLQEKDLIFRDESDSDGTFTLRNVPEGRYTLVALKNGWEMRWAKPGVLDPYLRRGVAVELRGSAPRQVTVEAQ